MRPVDLLVYDDEDQRYVPVLVALCGALLVALLFGTAAFLFGRGQPVESPTAMTQTQGSVTEPQTAAVEDERACEAAIERADAALDVGGRLEQSLSEQTSLMDDLLARRAPADQVLDRAVPPLTQSAKDRAAFQEALTAYEQARADCGT